MCACMSEQGGMFVRQGTHAAAAAAAAEVECCSRVSDWGVFTVTRCVVPQHRGIAGLSVTWKRVREAGYIQTPERESR